MIRKYHNNTLQTHPRHRVEESQNTNRHKTSGKQLKQSNPLPHQDDCQPKKNIMFYITKQGANRTNNGGNNKK